MAIGLSRLFNIDLPLNFQSPYKAPDLIDFWRRWHITLSTFLRDYLYFALGGNRLGTARRFGNLFVTMFLGGLWHGASWNFAFWGALHGLGLIVNHGWRTLVLRWQVPDPFRAPGLGRLVTFLFVIMAWVPFRAADLSTTGRIWHAMLDLHAGSLAGLHANNLIWLLLCLAGVWWLPNTVEWVDESARRRMRMAWRPTVAWSLGTGLLTGVAVTLFTRNSPFLYYQF